MDLLFFLPKNTVILSKVRRSSTQSKGPPCFLTAPRTQEEIFTTNQRPTPNTRPYSEYANSLARCAAFTTALISVTRSLPSSSSMIPSIVHPAGVVTASFNSAG